MDSTGRILAQEDYRKAILGSGLGQATMIAAAILKEAWGTSTRDSCKLFEDLRMGENYRILEILKEQGIDI